MSKQPRAILNYAMDSGVKLTIAKKHLPFKQYKSLLQFHTAIKKADRLFVTKIDVDFLNEAGDFVGKAEGSYGYSMLINNSLLINEFPPIMDFVNAVHDAHARFRAQCRAQGTKIHAEVNLLPKNRDELSKELKETIIVLLKANFQ